MYQNSQMCGILLFRLQALYVFVILSLLTIDSLNTSFRFS